jgi:predicted AlkP superfamily phosphohydrolase/phosphomutase
MTFDIVNPLIEMGHLANMAQLMREGSFSPLLSTVPSITPVAWSSFLTGKSPGDHGVYDWGIKTANHRMSIINANYLQDQSIWSILHRAGKKIGVIGLPMSYPPQPYPSFVIGGPLSPGLHSPFTFPRTLYQEIRENVGQYIIDYDKKQELTKGEASFVATMSHMAKVRGETTLYLMQKYPWDVLMPTFVATDRLQHCLWHLLSFTESLTPIQHEVVAFFDLVDSYIGQFIEATPDPKAVVVLSDHGFGPGRRKVSLNGWLMREGYLIRSRADRTRGIQQRLVALANRVGLTRAQLRKWLSRTGMLGHVETRINQVSTYELAFDWQRSVAFAGGPGIYLNVAGREQGGTVSPGEDYECLRQEIVEKLSKLRDPRSNQEVFEQVYLREDFYSGRRVSMAPDIVPLPRGGYRAMAQFHEEKSRRVREAIFDEPHAWDRGMHRREGILVTWGERLEANADIEPKPHIWDVTPTLLGLLDVPIPSDMTGRVIVELIASGERDSIEFADGNKVHGREAPVWDDDDDERLVEERLRGLGYLE